MFEYKVGDLIEALKSGEVSSIGHQAKKFKELDKHLAELEKAYRKWL